MKRLIAWFTRRQRCACGKYKLARAALCFDCTTELEDNIRGVFDEAARRGAL